MNRKILPVTTYSESRLRANPGRPYHTHISILSDVYYSRFVNRRVPIALSCVLSDVSRRVFQSSDLGTPRLKQVVTALALNSESMGKHQATPVRGTSHQVLLVQKSKATRGKYDNSYLIVRNVSRAYIVRGPTDHNTENSAKKNENKTKDDNHRIELATIVETLRTWFNSNVHTRR